MSAAKPEFVAFFSYSSADRDFALDLARDLREKGAVIWMDQLDIIPGERWDTAVELAIRRCAGMLVILSRLGRLDQRHGRGVIRSGGT